VPATVVTIAKVAGKTEPALGDREGKKMTKTNPFGALAAVAGAALVAAGLLVLMLFDA
jgi:hypothetical protein